jgi:photosystem II cytochrome c550
MQRRFSAIVCLILGWVVCLSVLLMAPPAEAAGIDPYVLRYLKVTEPVPINLNGNGETQLFSAQQISQGKRLFEENCKSCHVAGSTLPNPLVSLSLPDLQGATPPRDHVQGLVDYFRQPMTYDGTEDAIFCRQVPDTWLSQTQVENLAAFILKAAEKAPGWGTNNF